MGWFARARTQYQELVARYGRVAVLTYFGIFFSVLGGFWLAVSSGADLAGGLQALGMDTSSATGRSGTLVVAYGFTKLTQPLRIAATVVLTPVLARVFGTRQAAAPEPAAHAETPQVGPAAGE